MRILILHGVNHNMFGKRDAQIYGTVTLDDSNAEIRKTAAELGAEIEYF